MPRHASIADLWHLGNVQEPRPGSSASIALVAPVWLQDAMQVLLDGTSGVMLVASSTDVDSLVMLELDRSPDFILLDSDRDSDRAISEVERITRSFPKADCVVLAEHSALFQPMKKAGASLTLLKGATPQRLKVVLEALAERKIQSESGIRPPASRL